MPCGWEGNRIGLASHWQRVTDISGSLPTGSRPMEGDEHPPTLSQWSMVNFTLPIIMSIK